MINVTNWNHCTGFLYLWHNFRDSKRSIAPNFYDLVYLLSLKDDNTEKWCAWGAYAPHAHHFSGIFHQLHEQ